MSKTISGQNLIITIVHKEKGKKVIAATKKSGARGGTVFYGKGVKINEKNRFLGIPLEREREIVLTIVPERICSTVLYAICAAVNLEQPRQGVGFVIDTKKVTGMQHLLGNEVKNMESNQEDESLMLGDKSVLYDLIVTIVNKGDAEKVTEASKKAGAEGGTILSGRGTGIHEKAKLFNIEIEPEKEVVLTLINRDKTSNVLQKIEKEANLDIAGKGIAFVLEVEKTIGINHIFNSMLNE